MLPFEWDTYNWRWGDGPKFEVGVVRQFIVADDEDDEPRRLRLCFRYEPAAGAGTGHGASDWCASPDGLAKLRLFVAGSPAIKAVGHMPPQSIQLWYERP